MTDSTNMQDFTIAVERTWDGLAGDIPCDTVPAAEVVEICFDANRMDREYPGEAAWFRTLIDEVGYEQALLEAAKGMSFAHYEAGGAE